ncbi:MAG: hypothetical protein P8Y66_11620, partial [Nitrospirota bacterium]
ETCILTFSKGAVTSNKLAHMEGLARDITINDDNVIVTMIMETNGYLTLKNSKRLISIRIHIPVK